MTGSVITAIESRISGLTHAQLVGLLEAWNASPEAKSPEYATASVGIAIKMQIRKVLRPRAEAMTTATLAGEIRRIYAAAGWVLGPSEPDRLTVDVYCETLEERHGLTSLLDQLVDEADRDLPVAESNQRFIGAILSAAERA